MTDITKRLELSADFSFVELTIWGNDVCDNFSQKMEYNKVHERFNSCQDTDDSATMVVLILGVLNINTLERLKSKISNLNNDSYVIYAPGSFGGKFSNILYGVVDDIHEHIKIDYTYVNFPFDMEGILEVVEQVRSGDYDI